MLSAPIFNICEVERIALTILFRFNAIADKRHSSVTAGMPLFLILRKTMFSFEYRERSFCPYFAQTHHMPISVAANAFVASIKGRIATASKNSAPNTRLLKTSRVSLAMSASIALYLITPQVFSGCLAAVQPLVNEFCALRTTKCIFLG